MMLPLRSMGALFLGFLLLPIPRLFAGELNHARLQTELQQIAETLPGTLGACAQDAQSVTCVHGDRRFSLQSTVKLLVAMAALDAAEKGKWTLRTPVHVEKKDLSVFVQPLAKKIGPNGYTSTIAELIHLAVTESDSAACDILIEKLGGPHVVHQYLQSKGFRGIRVDRNERNLQTEIFGLKWRPEHVDAAVLDADIQRVSEAARDAAYARYRRDERDTATPRAATAMLYALAHGKLLNVEYTDYLLGVLRDTATGKARLLAGLQPGWRVGHKTGTSNTWKGVTMATNDIGFLTAPDGTHIAVSVFVGESTADDAARDKAIAKVAAAVVRNYKN